MHANMKDRDFFEEVVAECREQGVHPLAYFSVIHDNWAFQTHADWRIVRADGNGGMLDGRYGVVCPNSPYREYVWACVQEIASRYDIDGMFFDMMFWPGLCYCHHCTARFWREYGSELPRIVDWDGSTWRAFQKARQDWLLEFARETTGAVKRVRPDLTVNHQFATILHNWTLGVPLEMARVCDYVGGDFYGGPPQHSLACKVYHGLTQRKPFEFHTSRTRDFRDHVTVKPLAELRTESFVATLHSAALMLVDYINADGTLNPQVYDVLGELSLERAAYEPFLGGELMADVAIYFDKESLYNPEENGLRVTGMHAVDKCPHRDAVVGAARILQEAHVPFGVVTNANLGDLSRYRAVWLPYVLEMSEEQSDVFRAFVASGGILYASGPSSLDRRAASGPRMLLEDVLGVRFRGVHDGRVTYLTPLDAELARAISPQDHVSLDGRVLRVEAWLGSEVLAVLTPPFVEPESGRVIGSRFAAIHSDPPALQAGSEPAVVSHSFGKGYAVWTASPLESRAEAGNTAVVLNLWRRALAGPFRFEVDGHPAVEMTLFDQPERGRMVAGLLNLQRNFPQVPVDVTVRVAVPSARNVERVTRLPGGGPVEFGSCAPYVEFRVVALDAFAMFAVEYR